MMFLARKVLSTGVWPDKRAATQAMLKLEQALPGELRDRCEAMLAKLDLEMLPISSPESHLDIFSQLQCASLHQSKVRIVYEPPSKTSFEDRLHPYHLAFLQRGWYVFGYSEASEAVRTFKIERISDLRLLDEHFELDQPFDLSEYLGNAWQLDRTAEQVHVMLKFTPEAADSVEEVPWQKTQQAHRTEGDSLIFEVDVVGIQKISSWVLGHGEAVKVLYPPELGALVGKKARHVSQMYEESDMACSEDAPSGEATEL